MYLKLLCPNRLLLQGGGGGGGAPEHQSRSLLSGSALPSPAKESASFPRRSEDRVDRSEADQENTADRMSVRSATLSLYRSEESLERPNGKSLPASPFIRRPSKSNSFHSHVRLPEKYDSRKPLVLFTYLDAQGNHSNVMINNLNFPPKSYVF